MPILAFFPLCNAVDVATRKLLNGLFSVSYAQEEIMFRWWPSVSASIFNRRENEVENEEKKEDTIIGPVLLLGVSVQDFWPSEDCTSTKIAKTIFASSGGRHEGK